MPHFKWDTWTIYPIKLIQLESKYDVCTYIYIYIYYTYTVYRVYNIYIYVYLYLANVGIYANNKNIMTQWLMSGKLRGHIIGKIQDNPRRFNIPDPHGKKWGMKTDIWDQTMGWLTGWDYVQEFSSCLESV